MTGWECARCGQVHTQNPSSCRNCGHVIFNTLTEAELERQSTGVSSPKPMELTDDQVMGTAPKRTGSPSPDVAPDGSIVHEDTSPESTDEEKPSSWFGRIRSLLPF
jgi:predicted  nucleic acid-binding Zn-ribbon protein